MKLMLLTIFISLLFTFNLHAADCAKHPVYCQVLINKPKIDKKYAMKLSNAIYKASRKYRIPKHVYTAIIAQESGYKLNAVSKITGLHDGKSTTVIVDFCAAQINWRNVEIHEFEVDKLLTDMQYCIEAGAKILAGFKKRYSKKEKTWWTRYHSGNKIRRSEYKRLVERYL